MTKSGTWVSYGGGGAIALAGLLAVIAVAIAYGAVRLPGPVALPRPRRPVRIAAIALWPAAILALPVCVHLYVLHAIREHVAVAPPADPITPFTLIGTGILFCVIAMVHSSRGWRTALWSAVIAAIAAPVIFEFPFDLIVMSRTYPGLPPDPALYRALFFAPLIAIEVSTLALLAWSPAARLSRPTLWSLAAMFAVFAGWALAGFGYPDAPVPTTLNVVSKVLALLASLTLFVPARAGHGAVAEAAGARPARPAGSRAWTGVL
jgi:hypothetical protein